VPENCRASRASAQLRSGAAGLFTTPSLQVSPGLYRSGYPNHRNFAFLETLNLRNIIVIFRDNLLPANHDFIVRNNITLHHIRVPKNTEPFLSINHQCIYDCLQLMRDPEQLPLLIHCDKGED
jgi:tyrosine-protein phosphatase SIW14